MTEKQIELINKQLLKLDSQDFDLGGWKSSTTVILSRIFGDNYQGIKAIENIKYSSGGIGSVHWDNLASCKKQGKDILEACITEFETLCLSGVFANQIYLKKRYLRNPDVGSFLHNNSLHYLTLKYVGQDANFPLKRRRCLEKNLLFFT